MSRGRGMWLDGHVDVAALALLGRELDLPLEEVRGGPRPAALTWPSLREGRVKRMIATIFTAPGLRGPFGYPAGEAVEEAHRVGVVQLDLYRGWEEAGTIRILRTVEDLQKEEAEGFGVLLSLEGADPVRCPEEIEWWFERGVRLVGMSWSSGTRYAGGNARRGPLTSEGRELVKAMDRVGMIHDLSHLSDEAAFSLLEATQGPVIASHSNYRERLDPEDQRFLSRDLLRVLSERGGLVGLNLLSAFLCKEGRHRRATIRETLDHLEEICEIMESREKIGLGSDLDGGFGADSLPEGIQRPLDFEILCDGLAERGWSEAEIAGFRQDNWLRFLSRHLPS